MAFTARIHACGGPGELRRTTVRGIAELIGGDRVTFEHLAPTLPQLWAECEPEEPYQSPFWEIFLEHLDEHPAISRYRETGDPSAVKISDFVTCREWHRTQIYQKLYRVLGIEDQMGMCLGPPNREFYAVVLSRSRRNFSERDRTLLNLLRPHIAQAYHNARAIARLYRLAHQQAELSRWLTQSAVLVDCRGEVLHCPTQVRRWLKDYFSEGFQRGQLPVELGNWLQLNLSHRFGTPSSTSVSRPFVREKNGSRLICRLHAGTSQGHLAIVMEQQTVPSAVAARAQGLTHRQVEILVEVEKGKSNDEIASALFISPLTVRTHLDRIFDALNVNNRTAAVARLRGLV